jgi:LysM repeat protein
MKPGRRGVARLAVAMTLLAAGSGAVGVSGVAARASGPTTTGRTADQTYTVVAGDNLKRIAHQFHTTVPKLVSLNKGRYPTLLKNPYVVRPGWVLNVGRSTATASHPAPPAGRTYRVQRGDTLGGVAHRFHVAPARLVALNKGRYPSLETNPRLVPGWTLTLG